MRPATGGDENLAGRVVFVTDGNGVRVDNCRAIVEGRSFDAVQQVAIDGVQASDLGFLVVTQRRPVEGDVASAPAKALGILEALAVFRRVDVQLLRHAAHIHTGPAHVAVFCDTHTGAKTGGHPGGTNASRPCANHEEIEIQITHCCSS